MKQLHVVIDVEAVIDSMTFLVHPLQREAMLLMIKDSLRVYSSIQLILWELLCSFQKLTLEQSKWISKTYGQYFHLNERYQAWFAQNVKLGVVHHRYAPKFDTLPESLADKLKKYINDQEGLKKKKKKKKKKKRKNEQEQQEEEEDEDENELNHHKADKASNKSQKNNIKKKEETEQKDMTQDLLGFGDLFVSPTNNDDNFLSSLNVSAPEAVTNDQFAWSDIYNNNDNKANINKTNGNNANGTNNLDDFWSTVPSNNDNVTNNDFGSFVSKMDGNELNGNNCSAISGGTARVLKKKKNVTKDYDPFMDLLSFN